MQEISVVSLNMQNGQYWDQNNPDSMALDIQATADFLKSADADIILLQEVEHPDTVAESAGDTPNFHFLTAELPEYNHHFALPKSTKPILPFGYGLAIFSRYPILQRSETLLPGEEIEFEFQGELWPATNRNSITTLVEVGGKRLRIINTHLQAYFMIGTSAEEYPAQRNIVREMAEDAMARREAVLLGGDFNCTDKDTTIQIMRDAGLSAPGVGKPTWRRMPMQLDWILVSKELECLSYEATDNLVSDHLPLVARYRIKE